MADSRASLLAAVAGLHADIDRRAAELAERHRDRLRCRRGCSACCLDDLTVSPIEAARIREAYAPLLATGAPHPRGACAFLDAAGSCRIYAARPSVCRSQGLPLRMLVEDERDEVVERRDICPLNVEGGPAIEDLPEEACWLIGPSEIRLMDLDRRLERVEAAAEEPGEAVGRVGGEATRRVALRSLFVRSD